MMDMSSKAMPAKKMNLPLLFPCSSKVKVPQLGSEEVILHSGKPRTIPPFLQRPRSKTGPVSRQYVKKISTDLVFSEDVVKERCFHMLPYDDKYFFEALQLGDLIAPPPRTSVPTGRHNSRSPDKRHMPCHLKKNPRRLGPATDRSVKFQIKDHGEDGNTGSLREDRSTVIGGDDASSIQQSPFFLTETISKGEVVPAPKPDHVPQHEWDAFLMSNLSSTTAYWIVHKRMSPSEQQAALNGLLKTWYGEPEHTDLIREDTSEKDFDTKPEKTPMKMWKKSEANLLDHVYGLSGGEVNLAASHSSLDMAEVTEGRRGSVVPPVGVGEHPTQSYAIDPYSEDNKAPFYRQPAGLRRQIKNQEKQIAAEINATAREIEVKSYKPPQPVTLRDVVTPKVGSTLYDTENLFQQEWLTGAQQVSRLSGDKTKIVMTSDNTYEKQLQTYFPRPPESWCPEKSTCQINDPKAPPQVNRTERGIQKWKSLPKPIDDTAHIVSIIAPDYDPSLRGSPDPVARRNTKQNLSMMKVLEEWRAQWHLAGQYADSSPDDIIHDMADIQPHVRLKAVATIAKAMSYKAPSDPGIQINNGKSRVNPVDQLPEKIFRALEYLLNDKHDQVKRAAAIALYSMERPNQQAEVLMREAIKGENSADRWAAAQCLAHSGICDAVVVGEIIKQLLTTEDSIKHERAISLLSKVSADSMLVHSMVAEHLNSSSWRHKVIACKVFPTLQTNINKDITQKLADLMWNDWHKEVRSAAAQALGKTGQGKIVHDGLREKILFGPERTRIEALYRIGQLGIMTARLLPSFLKCFDDQYVSVRCETCITSGRIYIKDEAVLKKLLFRATYDTTWKVKALAIQTLGKIGVCSPDIKACLLWAMRYEDKEAVRAEACHSLIALGQEALDCDDLIDALQERLLVETSQLVKDQISDALKLVGINALDDVDMVADIKNAVRKLCTRNNIASQITKNEAAEERAHNKSRMIQSKKEQSDKSKDGEPHESSREEIIKRMKKRIHSPLGPPKTFKEEHHSSKVSTPDLSRENTMGTPLVDQELQDVLQQENTSTSRSTSPSSAKTKSRTTRPSSAASNSDTMGSQRSGSAKHADVTEGMDNDDDGHEEDVCQSDEQKLPESEDKKDMDGMSDTDDMQRLEGLTQHKHHDTGDDMEAGSDGSKGEEEGKEEDNLVNESQEMNADLGILVPVLEKNEGPQDSIESSQINNTQFKLASKEEKEVFKGAGVQTRSSSRRRLISQELQVERNKVQLEAVKSFNNLECRYGMMGDQIGNSNEDFGHGGSPVREEAKRPETLAESSSLSSTSSSIGEVIINIPVFSVTPASETQVNQFPEEVIINVPVFSVTPASETEVNQVPEENTGQVLDEEN